MLCLIAGIMPLACERNGCFAAAVGPAVMEGKHQMEQTVYFGVFFSGNCHDFRERQPLMAQQIHPAVSQLGVEFFKIPVFVQFTEKGRVLTNIPVVWRSV